MEKGMIAKLRNLIKKKTSAERVIEDYFIARRKLQALSFKNSSGDCCRVVDAHEFPPKKKSVGMPCKDYRVDYMWENKFGKEKPNRIIMCYHWTDDFKDMDFIG